MEEWNTDKSSSELISEIRKVIMVGCPWVTGTAYNGPLALSIAIGWAGNECVIRIA